MDKSAIARQLNDYIKEITRIKNVEKVILYGSYVKNKADVDSDIDLIVIKKTKNKKVREDLTSQFNRLAVKVRSSAPFHIYGVYEDEYRNAKPWSLLGIIKREGTIVWKELKIPPNN